MPLTTSSRAVRAGGQRGVDGPELSADSMPCPRIVSITRRVRRITG
ncbi:MAG: hypothetical protein U0133_10920 [Gemmatimonadales bacterium]